MVAGLFLLAAIPISMIVVLMYGSVSGSEFSPDDFTRRRFNYQRIPWLDWTVSGIEYTDTTPELEQTLMTNGLIDRRKSAGSQKKTWHLYFDSAVPDSHACDARFLTTYLDFSDWDSQTATSTPFWLTWNEQFPESAKIFWPIVADLARNEMYLIIPDVMRFAMNVTEDKPQSFQSELSKLTQARWITSGELDLQLGNYQRAIERFFRAELIEPSSKLTKLIALCRDQVEDLNQIRSRAEETDDQLKLSISSALANKDDDQESNNAEEAAEVEVTAEAIEPVDDSEATENSEP